MGFTLKGAPLSTKPRASTPGPHCCFPSTSRCKTIGSFRPCGVSPLRRFTPRSGRQFIAPGYRQGFIASAPSAATEVVASGRLATPHPRKNVPVGSPALLREHPLALAFQQPDTEVSENNAHTSPPPKRCGCGAARNSPACTRGRRPMCVEHEKRSAYRSTLRTQAPRVHCGSRGFQLLLRQRRSTVEGAAGGFLLFRPQRRSATGESTGCPIISPAKPREDRTGCVPGFQFSQASKSTRFVAEPPTSILSWTYFPRLLRNRFRCRMVPHVAVSS